MIYPNIWGNGALFAFSGIEGTNTLKDSMCGQLMSEHIGIAFDSHRVEMYLRLKEVSDFSFEAGASDVITGKFNQTEPFGFLFLKQNSVLGYGPENLAKPCCHADLLQKKEMGDTAVFSDGEHVYAFLSQRRPVSYTHLDVYKRQAIQRTSANFAVGLNWPVSMELIVFRDTPTISAS